MIDLAYIDNFDFDLMFVRDKPYTFGVPPKNTSDDGTDK